VHVHDLARAYVLALQQRDGQGLRLHWIFFASHHRAGDKSRAQIDELSAELLQALRLNGGSVGLRSRRRTG
jgi:hypothetical protein